jgi:hypothetical protein
MRNVVALLASLFVVLVAAARAHADEPPAPRLRFELGAGPAISLDGTRAPAHLGFGVELRPHIAIVAEMGHVFALREPDPDEGKLTTRFEHIGVGARVSGDVGPVVLFVTEMMLGARYDTEYRGGGAAYDSRGHAYGSLSRFGIEVPVAGPMAVGVAGQLMVAFDVLEAVEIDVGLQLHVAASF